MYCDAHDCTCTSYIQNVHNYDKHAINFAKQRGSLGRVLLILISYLLHFLYLTTAIPLWRHSDGRNQQCMSVYFRRILVKHLHRYERISKFGYCFTWGKYGLRPWEQQIDLSDTYLHALLLVPEERILNDREPVMSVQFCYHLGVLLAHGLFS